MAVYTPLTKKDIEAFLAQYDVGNLISFKGIAEGVENTNYLITTNHPSRPELHTKYILTIYEQRVSPGDLPFFLGLTEWLADHGIVCPRPVKDKHGKNTNMLKEKHAALIGFLEGRGNPHITPRHMELVGDQMARMHIAAKDFSLTRANSMGMQGWKDIFARFRPRADSIMPGLEKILVNELAHIETHWPRELPAGIIHADIFPDNIFFIDGNTDQPELSGIIDFYFACHDFFMYDLVICMNAWCFDSGHQFIPERANALLQAYDHIRPISKVERAAMPILARGAAVRFLMTRSHDWLIRPEGALVNPKDPMEYVAKLRFHQRITDPGDYGL